MWKTSYKGLEALLESRSDTLRIALSGGIDSITLLTVAARVRNAPTIGVHALSAAVPQEATLRCRRLAERFDWQLEEVNAGEFDNVDYRRNPVNRCYYCKSSLFHTIKQTAASGDIIATGTNADDLGDYRPGLAAARENDVWQPYVEAGIDKATIRKIAREEGLGKLSALPAQPCLSSRIETGISIDVRDLTFVHRVERRLSALTAEGDIRCRVTATGVVIQMPADNPVFSDQRLHDRVDAELQQLCVDESRSYLGIQHYRRGSAFLKEQIIER